MSKKAVRRVLTAAVLVSGLLASQAASAAEDPNNPGLPDPSQYECTDGIACTQYAGVATVGFASVERSRQWVHVAAAGAAALVGSKFWRSLSIAPAPEVALMRDLGLGEYEERYLQSEYVTRYNNYVSVVSPEGAPHPFGHFPPVTVRTVAFGSIPAEVTMHVSQVRDKDDLPVPLVASAFALSWVGVPNPEGRSGNQMLDAGVEGTLSVRLSDLVVDGVTVDLGSECKTAEPATLDGLRGKGGYWTAGVGATPQDELRAWRTTPYYGSILGGLLSGTIDIPAFTGCGVGGDDLSPLLTAMASGPGNRLSIRQSGIGRCFPTNVPLPCDLEPLSLPKEWHK